MRSAPVITVLFLGIAFLLVCAAPLKETNRKQAISQRSKSVHIRQISGKKFYQKV
jgi:hypothetical protein